MVDVVADVVSAAATPGGGVLAGADADALIVAGCARDSPDSSRSRRNLVRKSKRTVLTLILSHITVASIWQKMAYF